MASATTQSPPASADILAIDDDDHDDLVFFDAQESTSVSNLAALAAPVTGMRNLVSNAGVSETIGVRSSIASLSISRAGISGRLVAPSTWGTYKGKPAILLKMKFEFSSPSDCILKNARVEVAFRADYQLLPEPTPRIRDRAPSELRSANPTLKQVSSGKTLAPKIDAGGFGGGEIGQVHSDQNFCQVEGWSIISNIGAVHPHLPESKVWWDLSSNVLQNQGVKHHLAVALILEHTEEPFSAEFRLSGNLAKDSWFRKLMGKKEKKDKKNEVVAIKAFYPRDGAAGENLESIDLEDLVKENLVPTPGKPILFTRFTC